MFRFSLFALFVLCHADASAQPKGKIDPKWFERVALLSVEERAQAVAGKFKELNPDFVGVLKPVIENGMIATIKFDPTYVKTIEPLRAVPELKRLHMSGRSGVPPSRISDLSPLAGMKLEELLCAHTEVANIAPLKGMPLIVLELNETKVTDIAVVKGMPLKQFTCMAVRDMSPIRGMAIEHLVAAKIKPFDMTVLRGMPLEVLSLFQSDVYDLSELKGMPLTSLVLEATKVSNLQPLQGMKLERLNLMHCPNVRDLTPLKGMPLTTLNLGGNKALTSIKPLEGMKLETLYLFDVPVSDLSPLRGMPLTDLRIADSAVRDLSPLKGMPLEALQAKGLRGVRDLSPLEGLPIVKLDIDIKTDKDKASLRKMPKLTTINGKPAAEVLK